MDALIKDMGQSKKLEQLSKEKRDMTLANCYDWLMQKVLQLLLRERTKG